MDRLNRQSEDSLGKLLRAVNVQSTVYCVSDLRAPWAFRVEDSAAAKFHVAIDGRCELELDDGARLTLQPGELTVLPFGTGHTVGDRLRSGDVPTLASILGQAGADGQGRLRAGGRGRRTRLICGGFALADALPAPLLSSLPSALKLDPNAASGVLVSGVLDLLRAAADDTQAGATVVIAKLADALLTQALRAYLLEAERTGALQFSSMQHPGIARAIQLMRNEPQEPWTVARLAHEVGMSRTSFLTRFRTLVGQTPMRFLTRVRLVRAAGSLMTSNATLYAIARQAGYDTEASFSKAFRHQFGVAPGAYRKMSVEDPLGVASR
jgi:AraC-like DNA-binding protein